MTSTQAIATVSPGSKLKTARISQMKKLMGVILAAGIAATMCAGDYSRVREADLVFVVNPKGNAITSVTHAIDSLPIDHVAIIHRMDSAGGQLVVVEAVPKKGVCITPIDEFEQENGGEENIVIGRVEGIDSVKTVCNAMLLLGRPYDFNYMPDDSAVYCSELVQKCCVDTAGNPVFGTIPMTFRDASGEIHPYWVKHYADQGLDVPEGAPGTNPGQLSRHPRVTIFYNNPNPRASRHISQPD